MIDVKDAIALCPTLFRGVTYDTGLTTNLFEKNTISIGNTYTKIGSFIPYLHLTKILYDVSVSEQNTHSIYIKFKRVSTGEENEVDFYIRDGEETSGMNYTCVPFEEYEVYIKSEVTETLNNCTLSTYVGLQTLSKQVNS